MNLQPKLHEALKQIANEMQIIFGDRLKAVTLFGSYARGDYGEHSDVDIMVLVDMDKHELTTYRNVVSKVRNEIDEEYDYEFLVTMLLQDEYTFNRYQRASGFFKNVTAEGVKISA